MADDDAPVAGAETVIDNEPVDPAIAAIEGRARRMGWRPKDEFRGDPSRWTDAQTFVERGETELPVLRERYRALDDRFAKLERTSGETSQQMTTRLAEMSSAFSEFREFSKRGEERAYARAKAELEARMAAAVQVADQPGFHVAKSELDALNRAHEAEPPPQQRKLAEPPPVATAQPTLHPDAQAWVAENGWFNLDPVMTQYAVAVHTQLQRDRPGLSMRDNLTEVKADVMTRFPEKFENPRRAAATAVTSTPTGTPTKKSKGKYPEFSEWPADAKQAFAKYKAMMPDYTHDEYAKVYFAGDEK